jgi:hypothetical protein
MSFDLEQDRKFVLALGMKTGYPSNLAGLPMIIAHRGNYRRILQIW